MIALGGLEQTGDHGSTTTIRELRAMAATKTMTPLYIGLSADVIVMAV
jgi:hypothetical protein